MDEVVRSPQPQATAHLGVYVHFPWCEKRCPYCDFATRAIEPTDIPQTAYTNAVLREIALRRDEGELDAGPATVFFGGGTPSLWAPAEVGRVVRALPGPLDEVTLECNPASLDATGVRALLDAGITRLSVGVQSLHDHHLRFLGRLHDRRRALDAVHAAVSQGVRVSADLIFGMPGHSVDELLADATALLDLGVEHLSAYALTIEPGTQFGLRKKKGLLKEESADAYADLYDALRAHLHDRGWVHYEVSNFCASGAESRHNLGYWMGRPYVGLGAAAVGCVAAESAQATRYKNWVDAQRYQDVLGTGDPSLVGLAETSEALSPETRAREAIMLGLRTRAGVDLAAVREQTGIDVREAYAEVLRGLIEEGRVRVEEGSLRVPQDHWFRLDSIVLAFF